MIKTTLVSIACALALQMSSVAQLNAATVQNEHRRAMFAVSGYGKQFEEVDTADVVFSVSTRSKQATDAKDEHDEIRDRFSAYLSESGYERDKIKLESTRLWRDHGSQPTLADDFYICRSVYSMRTQAIESLSELQANLVDQGVDEILGVALFSANRRELEDAARKRAIDDAKQKAEFTCKELGWTLGKPVRIDYGDLKWRGYRSAQAGFGNRGGGGGTSTPANVGASTYVDANVTLTFEYAVN